MLGMHVVERVVEMIAERPDALLCDREGCGPCTGARRNIGMADG
jgi:hypothetical protein